MTYIVDKAFLCFTGRLDELVEEEFAKSVPTIWRKESGMSRRLGQIAKCESRRVIYLL